MLEVRRTSNKGWAVFALTAFKTGERLELSPVIFVSEAEMNLVHQTILSNYPYDWENQGEAFAMGVGSLFNHSYHPNACYVKHFQQLLVEFIAIREIQAGEEITINYNGSANNQSPVWFEVNEEPSV